jgi:hypothetical protein
VCESPDLVAAAKSVIAEVEHLRAVSAEELDTVLVIFDHSLQSFESYLDMLDFLNETLELNGLDQAFQLASFHPDYHFEGEAVGARSNYTNRSPYPIIHILRSDSMTNAISAFGQERVDAIPFRNIDLLNEMDENQFNRLFETRDTRSSDESS